MCGCLTGFADTFLREKATFFQVFQMSDEEIIELFSGGCLKTLLFSSCRPRGASETFESNSGKGLKVVRLRMLSVGS